jgi:hypothetical protein
MATVTQTGKRKPLADGELFSVGANVFTDGQWRNFKIGVREEDDTDSASTHRFTTLSLNREEAERVVRQLSEYLAATKTVGP